MKFVNVLTGFLGAAAMIAVVVIALTAGASTTASSATVQSESNTEFGGRGGLRKLDGPVVCSATSEDFTDTEIRSDSKTTSMATRTTITVDNNDGGRTKGLIKVNTFDIPSGKGLASATLKLHTTSGSTGTFSGHRMKKSWSDSSTWNSFGSIGEREKGFCVKSNGHDQNSGVHKLEGGDFWDEPGRQDTEKVNRCLDMCAAYQGATGCEMIWDQWNRGCYVHTDTIAKGNNVGRHSCYLWHGNGIQLGNEANIASSFVFTGPPAGNKVELDVTDDVKFWMSGGLNEGWMIQTDSGDGWDFITANHNINSPVLELTYYDDGECPREIYNCKASAWGDPHIVTFDGLKFDAQPKGEAIFLTDSASALQVQARLVALGTRGGVPAVIEGVAVQGYDEDSPIIEVSVGDGPATIVGCSVELIVTGDKKTGLSYNSENATVSAEGKYITIEYQDLLRIDMKTTNRGSKCYFSIDVTLFDCGLVKETVRGILGSPNDNPNDDWMKRNGTSIPIPRGASSFFFEPAFDYCKENWIIEEEEESLFDYTGTTTFSDVSVPDEEFDNEYQRAVEEAHEDLIDICGDDIGCLVDGVELGPDAAEEYLENPACVRSVVVDTEPTVSPTASPTASPTTSPTPSPTTSPTPSPTTSPTPSPTTSPTPLPTTSPTPSPTEEVDDLICPE